jgi:myosin heavy subunit
MVGLGIADYDQRSVYSILAGILSLGNITFARENERTLIVDEHCTSICSSISVR